MRSKTPMDLRLTVKDLANWVRDAGDNQVRICHKALEALKAPIHGEVNPIFNLEDGDLKDLKLVVMHTAELVEQFSLTQTELDATNALLKRKVTERLIRKPNANFGSTVHES